MTIRWRLLLLLLPALAVLMTGGGMVDYWIAVATTRDALDRALGEHRIGGGCLPERGGWHGDQRFLAARHGLSARRWIRQHALLRADGA